MSAPKTRQKKVVMGVGIFALIVLTIGAFFWFVLGRSGTETVTLKAPQKHYQLEVVTSDADQAKGLGDRDSMPSDRGMLFKYDTPRLSCFWMKDMRFPLDMMWLDANKRVIHSEANISPKSYPKFFCTMAAAQYVIELNAGEQAKAHISQGAQLSF